jgi:hypothetical protein
MNGNMTYLDEFIAAVPGHSSVFPEIIKRVCIPSRNIIFSSYSLCSFLLFFMLIPLFLYAYSSFSLCSFLFFFMLIPLFLYAYSSFSLLFLLFFTLILSSYSLCLFYPLFLYAYFILFFFMLILSSISYAYVIYFVQFKTDTAANKSNQKAALLKQLIMKIEDRVMRYDLAKEMQHEDIANNVATSTTGFAEYFGRGPNTKASPRK